MAEIPSHKKRKLSYTLAQRIARDIIKDGWVAGRPIGREPDLLKKYGVSRDPFREAVRILEWQGIAKSSRGPGGGLQVAAPAEEAIINILRDYLELTDITFDEVIEASRILDSLVVRLATERLTDQGIDELQRLVQERRVLHKSRKDEIKHLFNVFSEIGKQTGNPAIALFMEPLHYILVDYADVEAASEKEFLDGGKKAWSLLNQVVQSVISGDASTALRHMNDYLDQINKGMRPKAQKKSRRKSSIDRDKSQVVPKPLWLKDSSKKMAQSLIYQIKNDIKVAGLKIGDRVGHESSLIKKYGVSRSIFREAVRLLELIGLAELRKGRDGGLVVSTPDPSGAVSATVLFLEYVGFGFDQLNEARTALDEAAAQLAATKLTEDGGRRLHKAIESEADAEGLQFIETASRVAQAISELSGNRVLALYIEVMINASVFKPIDKLRMDKAIKNAPKLKRSHRRLVEAITMKDSALARRRMMEHAENRTNALSL